MTKNNPSLNDTEITYLNKSIGIVLKAKNKLEKDIEYSTEIPHEIGLQLTNFCNLRCKTCYEWNEKGFYKHKVKSEIDFEIIEKVIQETEQVNARLFIWGGEPLLYSKWDNLIDLLIKHPRESVICTNGTLIIEKIDSILKLPIKPNFLIGLDGLEESNNIIRGKGTFNRIMANADELFKLKQIGDLSSAIAFNTVLTKNNVKEVEELIKFLQDKGADTIFLSFPWYINEDLACKFDDYLANKTLFPYELPKDKKGSWHSYTFGIDKDDVNAFYDCYENILKKDWTIRIKLSPDLIREKALEFITGNVDAHDFNKKCIGLANRVEVSADGSIGSCSKFYPELFIGNLKNSSLRELWKSDKYQNLRRTVNKGLMPICNYCYVLHHYEK